MARRWSKSELCVANQPAASLLECYVSWGKASEDDGRSFDGGKFEGAACRGGATRGEGSRMMSWRPWRRQDLVHGVCVCEGTAETIST